MGPWLVDTHAEDGQILEARRGPYRRVRPRRGRTDGRVDKRDGHQVSSPLFEPDTGDEEVLTLVIREFATHGGGHRQG